MPNVAPRRSIIVARSILSEDFQRLAEEVRSVDAAGAAIREDYRSSVRKARS